MNFLKKFTLLALLLVSQNVLSQEEPEPCNYTEDGSDIELLLLTFDRQDWYNPDENGQVGSTGEGWFLLEADVLPIFPNLYDKVALDCRNLVSNGQSPFTTEFYGYDQVTGEEIWLDEGNPCRNLSRYCSLPPVDGDEDSDGVQNGTDNCLSVWNPDQTNSDSDEKGDVCDDDDDNDTVMDSIPDNCRTIPNPDQKDEDNDGEGDVCDLDDDDDGVFDTQDNCPMVDNPDQKDEDGDLVGDACDYDIDGDSIDNESDNCPLDYNPGQENDDDDARGDVCDPDSDSDGVDDDIDNCPAKPNPDQADSDGNGEGDACDCDFTIIPTLNVNSGKKTVVIVCL